MQQIATNEIAGEYCENIDKVIVSKDFRNIFGKILDSDKSLNKDYYLNLLDKINTNQSLTKKEQQDFINLLEKESIIQTSEEFLKKLKAVNFTINEVKEFLKNYPVEKIIEALEDKVSRDIVKIIGSSVIEVSEEYEDLGLVAYKIKINNDYKYCIKKKGEEIKEEDFIFDNIIYVEEINGEFYYETCIGDKEGHIKLGDEKNYKEKVFFDGAGEIQQINGELYYEACIGDKKGHIKLGDEKNYKDKIIFNYVCGIRKINGELYYYAKIGDKKGHIKLGDEKNYKEKVIFDGVGSIEEKNNGKFYYETQIGNKGGYIELGDEKNYKEKVIFDWVGSIEEKNGKLHYKALIGDKDGEVNINTNIFCYKVLGFIKKKISLDELYKQIV